MGLAEGVGCATRFDDPSCFEVGKRPTRLPEAGREQRILCLHGWHSSNEITRLQLHNIGLRDLARCDLLHGVLPSSPYSNAVKMMGDGPGRDEFHDWHRGTTWAEVEPALRRILHFAKQHGPYDGIYGFSMGASMATWLSKPAVLAALGVPPGSPPPWRFVVCGCGADTLSQLSDADLPTPEELSGNVPPMSTAISIPSLHIIGKRDSIRQRSERLAGHYLEDRRTVVWVDEAHELPMTLLKDDALLTSVSSFIRANEVQ